MLPPHRLRASYGLNEDEKTRPENVGTHTRATSVNEQVRRYHRASSLLVREEREAEHGRVEVQAKVGRRGAAYQRNTPSWFIVYSFMVWFHRSFPI